MYLVPQDRPLVVASQVEPIHVDQVHVGPGGAAPLSAFDQRQTPELTGRVVQVSADAFTDEQSRMSYYRADIEIEEGRAAKLPEGMTLLPGMPVEAFIRTGRADAHGLFLKPLTDYFAKAFRETDLVMDGARDPGARLRSAGPGGTGMDGDRGTAGGAGAGAAGGGGALAPMCPFVQGGGPAACVGADRRAMGAERLARRAGRGHGRRGGRAGGASCGLQILAQVRAACEGDWDRLLRVVKLTGFVASLPSFGPAQGGERAPRS
jgi:hypothetical protein